ncbi:MAG: hypothetical protein HN952_04085 [Candidatus Cloacimonetes bacterium]|nr:hypothetical protein [Candidatus Cloacimonadota bacterium]MBT6994116.1 hypothetical protein [Candidatus Cloacimonadota bacterium]MBT7469943.1 hypothetical protein [Candidatus Cloacimonadota bacterium]
MKKYILGVLGVSFCFAQFENVPENENIILLVGPDNYYQSSVEETMRQNPQI